MDEFEDQSPEGEYRQREDLWDEAWPTVQPSEERAEEPDDLDETLHFPETVGTVDTLEAARDAEPYVPPIDPPVLPGGGEGIHVATGFGLSTDEELAGEPRPRGDEDIHDEALLALEQDSLTSTLPLSVEVRRGVVHLQGYVGSDDEAEHAASVLSYVPGVVDVIDDTTVNPDAAAKPPNV